MRQQKYKKNDTDILEWLSYDPEYRQQCIDYAVKAIKTVADQLNISQYNTSDNTRDAVFQIMYNLVEIEIAPENPDEIWSNGEMSWFNSLTECPFDYDLNCRGKMELHRILEKYIIDNYKNLR